ncbi:MAG: hypothetical protein ABIQ03_11005 [Burkholderiales bacterium]
MGAPMMENGALADAGGAFVVWGQNVASDVALSDPWPARPVTAD